MSVIFCAMQASGTSEEKKKTKEEMELRLKLLSEMEEKLKDEGECPLYTAHLSNLPAVALHPKQHYTTLYLEIFAGPMLDCVVWHDGEVWRAALDTRDMYEPGSSKGALADFTPMTNFRLEREYRSFSPRELLWYSNLPSQWCGLTLTRQWPAHRLSLMKIPPN